MRKFIGVLLVMATTTSFASEGMSLLDQDFRRLASDDVVNLSDEYAGKVVLVVNTASKCGNTPQYDGLEKLYQEYGDDGLVVLGFPSNDFLGQEPGTEEEIFDQLAAAAGTYPTWNFHKYLIGRDGQLISEFSPRTQPYSDELLSSIKAAINN
jgi:glutathione peroxidase